MESSQLCLIIIKELKPPPPTGTIIHHVNRISDGCPTTNNLQITQLQSNIHCVTGVPGCCLCVCVCECRRCAGHTEQCACRGFLLQWHHADWHLQCHCGRLPRHRLLCHIRLLPHFCICLWVNKFPSYENTIYSVVWLGEE